MADSTAPKDKAKSIEYVLARVESSGFGLHPGTFEVCRKTSNAKIEMSDPDTGEPFYSVTLDDPYQVFGVRITTEDWQPPEPAQPHQKFTCTLYEKLVDGMPTDFVEAGEGGPLVRMDAGEHLYDALMLASASLAQWFTTGNGIIIDALRAILVNPYLAFTTADALLWRNDAQALGRVADAVAKEAPEADRGRLASALFSELDGFGRAVRAKAKTLGDALKLDEGIPFWDAELARRLEAVGAKAEAEELRKARSKLSKIGEWWGLWLPSKPKEAPRAVQILAHVLWQNVVLPSIERARAKPAALVHAVYEPAAHLFSRVRREEERNGQRSLILPGDTVARIATSAAAIGSEMINALMVDRGLKLFGTVTAHRVLRWQIFRAHQQALEGNPDPRVVRVPGGYRALTHEELGIKSKAEEGNVRDIIEAMHATELPMPPNNAYTRLLIRTVYPAQGRRPGSLELVLGTMLLPDYVQELQRAMGHSLQARTALRLVPVLPLPPFIGREREYGPQATLSMLVVAHIRGAGRELIEQGGAKLDAETLARLAASSGLPAPLVPALIDRWTQDGDDGPALLKRVDKDRFTLGDAHKDARDFIEKGCKREHDGAIGGQRSAAKRAKDIERLGRKGSRGR